MILSAFVYIYVDRLPALSKRATARMYICETSLIGHANQYIYINGNSSFHGKGSFAMYIYKRGRLCITYLYIYILARDHRTSIGQHAFALLTYIYIKHQFYSSFLYIYVSSGHSPRQIPS